jgi:hypothetical protein
MHGRAVALRGPLGGHLRVTENSCYFFFSLKYASTGPVSLMVSGLP